MAKNNKPLKKNEIVEGVITSEIVLREAPKERMLKPEEIIMPAFSQAQLRVLTNQTPKWAIKVRQGKGGMLYKYVPHGYVTDMLNKLFGFDWDLVIDPIEDGKMYSLQIEKFQDGTETRHVSVAGHLIVRAGKGKEQKQIVKYGFGSQTWNKTMEFGDALKGARSDLIKTCAYQLGIALDLYYNEKAELDSYVEKQNKQNEAQRITEQLKPEVPNTPILLLTRSQSDFGFDGAKVASIAKVQFDEIMTMSAKEIEELWKKVVKHASK